ncbi:DUF4174 domain-containing protein [uncultured Fibrella sp.]|uniref:DUF4174 domain-containing protein n=1 Tax=uncultured Fibrella sp. TaxID=1284596 RepID=UPI0035CA3B30
MISRIVLLFTLMSAVTNSLSEPGKSLEARIAGKKWQRRVVLVYARDAGNADLVAQKRVFAEQRTGFTERDFDQIVVLESDLTEADRTYLRGGDRKLSPTAGFMTYLIGKDGGVKQRFSKPVATSELFQIVDAMPMRQSEMGRKN